MSRPVQLTACWFHADRDATHRLERVVVCAGCAERITARMDREYAARVPRPIDGAA